uniref:Uncharacterized protein n=1 Tax=Vitis vinifera TaxID=29760 RepID=A5B0F3_VITVI|nr:hypothetical protein VITISV_001606 [Vitis vinifera]
MVITRKLDRAEREFRTPQSKVRKFSHRTKPPPGTRVPFRTPQAKFGTVRIKVRKFRTPLFKVRNSFQGAKISIQGAKIFAPCETLSCHTSAISHTPSQFLHRAKLGAKLDSRCEILSPRCEFSKSQFRTPLFKVRKISHRAKPPPGTRVPFRTPQANFRIVRNKVRKFRTVRN